MGATVATNVGDGEVLVRSDAPAAPPAEAAMHANVAVHVRAREPKITDVTSSRRVARPSHPVRAPARRIDSRAAQPAAISPRISNT